jgi:hypothetical protein
LEVPLEEPLEVEDVEEVVEPAEEDAPEAARWSLPKKSHHTLSTLWGSFW